MQYNAGIISDPNQDNFTPESKTILDFVNPFSDIKPPSIGGNQDDGNSMQNSLSSFAKKPSSDTAKAAPAFFNYDNSNADRYTNSAYYKEQGFDPGIDNETKYGNRQTWGNAIGNAIGGGGKLAWQTFKSGWEGWGDMANALFSWDSSKLTGSPEDLAELYKNQNDAMNKYAIFSTPDSQSSIWNKQFFTNMLQQGGFALGASAQFLSEELLTMGASTALSSGKLALEGAEFTNRAIKMEGMIKDLKSLGDIWKSDSLVAGIVNGAKKLIPLSETAEDITKAYKAGAGTLQLAYIGAGGVKRALAEANMAFTEARMEGSNTYGDLNKRLTDEFIARTGQQPVGDELSKIRDNAYQAGKENFDINSGILMLSNRLEFENLFNKFGYERRVLKEMGDLGEKVFSVTGSKLGSDEFTKVYEKGILGAAGKYADIASDFGKRTAAWEATKSIGKGIFHWETIEGIQEVLQDLSNNTMQDYYYNLYHGVKGYTRGKALTDYAIPQEENEQGLQTFLMGALTGRLLSPLTYGLEKGVEKIRVSQQDRSKFDADKTNTISTLNAFYADPKRFLKEEIASFKSQDAASKNMEDAVAARDQYVFNNMKDSSFSKIVTAAKKTDMLESILDTIRGYGDHIKPEEFSEGFGMEPTTDNIKNTKEYFNIIADRIESFSKDYEHLNDKYSDLIQPELYKEGSIDHFQALVSKKALDDSIEILATNKFKSQRALERSIDILNDLSKNKSIATSSLAAFNILTSEDQTNKQIDLLSDEVKSLSTDTGIPKDSDTKQQIKVKKEQLKAIQDWKKYGFKKVKDSTTDRNIQAINPEKAKKAYESFINSKNLEGNLKTKITRDDIDDTFESMGDYAELKNDHEDYIDAYNILANPRNFVKYHNKAISAIKSVRDKFLKEHLEELDNTPKEVIEKDNTTLVPTEEDKTLQKGLESDLIADPNSETSFESDLKPRFEETGFNKTFGRQYLDGKDTIPNTQEGTDRFFEFTSKQNILGQDYILHVVSKHNDTLGIVQSDINPDDIKVIVTRAGDNDDFNYIDKNGKVIPDGEVTKDNIIYRSLVNINSITPERVRNDYTVHETTTDQAIQKEIDNHKEYIRNLIERTKEEDVFLNAISASPGIQRIERLENGEIVKAPVEGRLVEDNPKWDNLKSANNPEFNIALRVETAPDGGSIAPGIQPGRAVMQEFSYNKETGNKIWGDKVTRVFNRELTPNEKKNITKALVRLSVLFGRKDLNESEQAELKLIQGYIKNIIAWGNVDPSSDRFFYINNGLNRGLLNIPLTEKSIKLNSAKLLDNVYHHINNHTLINNEEFDTIKFTKEGKAIPDKNYSTYQEYLLSHKDDNTTPPVYASLPRVDSGIPQITQSYINWTDPNVQVEKTTESIYKSQPKEVRKEPTTNITQAIQDFSEYKTQSISVNGVEIYYKNIGGQIAIEFKRGSEVKQLEPFQDKDHIIRNSENIRKEIIKATGYNPANNLLRDLASTKAKENIISKQEIPGAKSGLQSLINKAKEETFKAPEIEVLSPDLDESTGETKYYTIESAIENSKPKNGELSAKVYEKNITTGDTRLAYEATVKIPDGKLGAAKSLLKTELMKQLTASAEEEAPYRLSLDEMTRTEDFKSLKTFIDKNLPQFNVNKVAELIHGKAWGAFMKGAIYIYNNAEIGTGFHEAFEGVWASYLSDPEQQDLINEFKSRSGKFTNPFSKETKSFSQASDYDAREMMAEEFRNYVLDNQISKNRKVQSFFEKVWNFIKNLLGLNAENKTELNNKINKLFKNINTGGFRQLNPIRELNQQSPVYRAVDGLSQEETAQAIEGLTYNFFLELYKNGNNIDSLLNTTDPKLSNKLLNKMFDAAHLQVLEDASIIGERLVQVLNNQKKELYNEFKNSVSKYGLDFNESDDLLAREENTTNALGIRDSISINPVKMSSMNVKLLISSLPDTKYSKAGKQVVKRNSLNQPKLVDFDRTHMLLLNELSNIVSIYNEDGTKLPAMDLMFNKLDSKYKNSKTGYYRDGYQWIRNIKLRLKYEDISGTKTPVEALSPEDMNLRVGFIKSFTNVKTTPQKTLIGEDGYVYSLNPLENINVDRIRENWSNNLKDSISSGSNNLVNISPSGIMTINRELKDYRDIISNLDTKSKIDLDKSIDILSKLGIEFTSPKSDLVKQSNIIRENTIQILEQIKSGGVSTIGDIYGSNIIDGRIDTLLAIEAGFTGEDSTLSYRNADGEAQYSVGIPSLLSNVINTLNSVKNLKELVQTSPWIGVVDKEGNIKLNPYQSNSELLRLGGILFDEEGNRKSGANLVYQVISGVGTSDFEGTSTDDLQFPERVSNKIHYLLNNIVYSNINSDKATEFGIGIPGKNLISIGDVSKLLFLNSENSTITEMYVKQLEDEMSAAAANKISPSNIQYYKNNVEKLGHFRDILGPKLLEKFYTSLNKLGKSFDYQDFINSNRSEIEDSINNYLNNKANETVDFLKSLDIFTKPEIPGNDLYITNAIDNDSLVNILKIADSQKVIVGVGENNEKIIRQGFTESDLKTLAGYLAFNEEVLINEQHKLIYGHPAFYKDLPKRANGATSTKESMVDDPDVLKWMDNHMSRNDGKVRSSENHPTISVRSFKDNEVVSSYTKDIAEGMYKDMSSTESNKAILESKIGATFDDSGNVTGYTKGPSGFIKAYLALNEADAMAWGMPDAIRDILFTTGKLTKEQSKQFDYEIAYEKLALDKRSDIKTKYSPQELEAAEKIIAQGNPEYIFPVLKPQYFGYANTDGLMHPVFLKHAVQPKFFRQVEGTQFEKIYLAAKANQDDILGFESGEKVGNVESPNGGFVNIYNTSGQPNITIDKKGNHDFPTDLPQQKLFSKFYGIQVEMAAKMKNLVVRGTQVTKLVMLNFFDNGKAINTKSGKLIEDYKDTLTQMMSLGKENLLKEIGLKPTENGYETDNLNSLVKTLRSEAQKRDLPDNMIDGINSIVNEDGSTSLKYKFDTLTNRDKIDNILNAIVDSRVISEKLNGKASTQVPSTLYESSPRDFMYLKDGIYTKLNKKDVKSLTSDEKASVRMQSSDLKFYRNENGKISQMEVYIAWPYKNVTPEEMGLKLSNGVYKLDDNSTIDKRLLDSIGFRIPTQAMNSIESMKIKGFTPISNGDMIVVPSEIVGKAGSDFDIDKINTYLANHFYNSLTKNLDYLEWKGDYNSTKDYYNNLYDRGELLTKEQGIELDRYIAEENSILDVSEPEDKLLKDIFSNLFTEEQLTKEFINSLSNSTERKESIVSELSKKALQNHFIGTMGQIIQDPSNYRQLVTPNSTDDLKSLADEINEYKTEAGTKNIDTNEKSYSYLRSFIGNNTIRERYLTAKRMVGIAAINSTLHSLAQVSGLKLEGSFLTKGIYYLAAKKLTKSGYYVADESKRNINIKLTHHDKSENGEYNIGHKNDAAGNLISEDMSQKLSGFVDGAKDPFVFDLNLNMNTSSTWFYLNHLGAPEKEISYFFAQPIMDKYLEELNKNRSGFKKINGESLNNEQLFYKVTAEYFKKITGRDILDELSDVEKFPKSLGRLKVNYIQALNKINSEFERFSPEELIKAIKQGDKADPKLQIAVLMNYVEYNAQSRLLSNFIQAIGYDNRRTKSVQENMLQASQWERSKIEGFIANPEDILTKTFLGEMKKQKEDIFPMFKDFFVTLSPSVQAVFKPLENKLNNPDFFATKDNKTELISKYQNHVIGYILHTTGVKYGTDIEIALNQTYQDMFQGKDSMAKILNRYKKNADPNIKDNLVIKELLPLMNDNINRTDNISLFRNKIDTFKTNNLIEALDNLKSYAQQTADDDLERFVDNLAKFSIMQSGLQNSNIDFKKILSTNVYSELVKTILDKFDVEQDLDPFKVWKTFHQNNWKNTSIVPKAPSYLKLKDGYVAVGENAGASINDYMIKYIKKPGLTRAAVNEMRRNKTFSQAFLPILLEKTDYIPEVHKYIYRPVNRLGDGYRFLEIYKDDRPSVLPQNGNIETDFDTPVSSGNNTGWLKYTDLFPEETDVNVQPSIDGDQQTVDTIDVPLEEQKESAIKELKDKGIIQRDC